MEFRILGPLEVLDGEKPVEIAGVKRRAVLALLLLHANEVVRSERLIDELWGEAAPRNAPAALHSHVSRLRKALGPEVLARREWGYVLRVDPASIDLRRFEQLVSAAEPLPARERSARLNEALALWRGPALADLAGEPSLQAESARLDELRLTTVERRIDADLETGRAAELVGELETLIAANPLREHLRWQLILALYRAGRQAEALEVYRETRRVLTEELGLEPSPALKELERAILRQDPAIAATTKAPPLASGERARRSTRRGVLLAVVAFALLGLGLGLPLALIGHRTVQASPVAAHSTPAHIPAAPPATTSTTHVPKRVRSPRHRSRAPQRSKKRVAQRSAGVPAKATTAAAPKHRRAATIPASKRSPPKATKPRIVTISDDFSGSQIDGTIWYQIYQGSGWNLSQQDGRLEFSFPPGTAPGRQWDNYGGHVGTLCKFRGNFDAHVSFTLVQWPSANGLSANLRMFFQPNNQGWAGAWRSSSAQWGEQYGGALNSGQGGSASLNDTSGTLRLRRRSGLVTAYFLHNGQWIRLASGHDRRTGALTVGVESAQNPPVRDDRVVVDFDNFTVRATNPICPPGTQGSG